MTRFFRALAATLVCAGVLFRAASALAAPAYLLVDMDSGDVLAQQDAGELWYPASLTKLMTIYLTFTALQEGRLQLDSPVVMSARANAEPPAHMGFPNGTVVTVDNAIKMLMVKSANDVAVAVAEMMGGSVEAFVADMNRMAATMGLTGTHFVNPNGLPEDGQSSTARDLAFLARTIWLQFPEYRGYFDIPAIRYGTSIMPTPNSLLDYYAGANGMKTGYICASGYNVVATATRNGRTLLVVVLGESSIENRAITAAHLLDAGFQSPMPPAHPPLAIFNPAPSTTAAVDLRSTICPGNGAGDEPLASETTLTAALGPRIALGPPIEVTTGGADPAAILRVDVPLPHPRPEPPPLPPDALGVGVPTADEIVPLPRPRPA